MTGWNGQGFEDKNITHHQGRIDAETDSSQSFVAFIGIGSNIGDRLLNCREAIHSLRAESSIEIIKISSLYETAPVGFLNQGPFFNAVLAIGTTLSPEQLMRCCQAIESQLGKKIEIPKGPRTIDLDLLFYGKQIITSADLTLPHPEISNRHFVLIPLFEIAPDLVHPSFLLTIDTLLSHLETREAADVIRYLGQNWEIGREVSTEEL